MRITLKTSKDGVTRVLKGGKFIGVIRNRSGHMLCYFNGRHTTTQNLNEVIRFFNGDFDSYYYRVNGRD